MPKLILANKSAVDQLNKSIAGERLVNIFPVAAPEGSNTQFELRSVPGTRDFGQAPGPFFRAMRAVEGVLYAVAAGGLHLISRSGGVSFLAPVPDDPNTSMAGHRSAVTITADGGYFVWANEDIESPAPGRLGTVGSVAFLDQFTILGELSGREVEWTEVGTPGTRNGLNFKTAEARDDKIIRVMDNAAYFGVFKEQSSELWTSTGTGGFTAFERVQGGVTETGLKSFNLVCHASGRLFFVGHDNVAYLTDGGSLNGVSPPQVNTCLKENKPTHCFYYEDRGHRFCVIRFADRPAWVYDDTMSIWHERSSGVNHDAWAIIAAEYCYDEWHLADELGRIYRLGRKPTDATGPMRRTIVSRELYLDGARSTVKMLEFLGRFGHSSVTETGPNWLIGEDGFPLLGQDGEPLMAQAIGAGETISVPARLSIRISRDGSNVFGLPKIRSVGRVGDYEITCRFRAMGQYRKMIVEINMTDPVDIPLFSEANVEI